MNGKNTDTFSLLFREENIAIFASQVAAELGAGALRIASVGVGEYQLEVWTLGAALRAAGIDFTIDGYDNDASLLTTIQNRTNVRWVSRAAAVEKRSAFPYACLESFEPVTDDSGRWMAPDANLRKRAHFVMPPHDIVADPLPAKDGGYHAVVMNNVLKHYNSAEQTQAIRNIVAGLAIGGILVVDEYIPGYLRDQIGLRQLQTKPRARYLYGYDAAHQRPEPPEPKPPGETPPPMPGSGDSLLLQLKARLITSRNTLAGPNGEGAIQHLQTALERFDDSYTSWVEASEGSGTLLGVPMEEVPFKLEEMIRALLRTEDVIDRYERGL